MNEESPLQFPCQFPIKVMGLATSELDDLVTGIFARHTPSLSEDAIRKRPSRNGKYVSLTVTIHAQSRHQLDAIYQDLTASEHVLFAL